MATSRERIAVIAEDAQVVAPELPAVRPEEDPLERWVVASARAGAANLLISEDKDLVLAGHGRSVRFRTPRFYCELLHDGAGVAGLVSESP